jgi:hypothetical protein
MKKIYLMLLLFVVIITNSHAATFKLISLNADITIPGNWRNTSTLAFATAGDFVSTTLPLNTWLIDTPGKIASGETFNVRGNVTMTALGRITKNGSLPSYVFIGGDFNMGGTTYVTQSITAGEFYLYVYGNFSVTGTAYFSTAGSNPQNYNHIHFCDTSLGGFSKNLLWNSTVISHNTSLTIDRRSTRLLTSNIPVPHADTFKVRDTLLGTLLCDTKTMNFQDSTSFVIADSASIYTKHAGGLDSALQHTDSFSYSSKANYFYNGTVPQVTGITLPDTIGWSPTAGTLNINNAAGVTLNDVVHIRNNGFLNLIKGIFINSSFLHAEEPAYVNVDAGTLSAPPDYRDRIWVTYMNLGVNALAQTTGYEMRPLVDTTIVRMDISKTGATITLGSDVKVYGAVYFINGNLDASVNNYNITIHPSTNFGFGLIGNNSGLNAFIPRAGAVIFNAGSNLFSVVGGLLPIRFNNLTINNPFGMQLLRSDTVTNLLTLTAGKVTLTNDTLVFGPSALPVAGAPFTSSNYIIDNYATSRVIKQLAGTPGAFLFPVGDAVNYSPISLDFTGSVYGANAYASPVVHNVKQPNNANVNNYLKRYWSVDLQNITAALYSVTAQYVPSDVFGSENLLTTGQYSGTWAKFNPTNVATHTLTTAAVLNTNTLPNDFTGIDVTLPSVVSSHDTILCMPSPGITLKASLATGDPGLAYTWSPSTGLTTTTGAIITANPTVSTVYTLTITDGNGFTNTATTSVSVNAAPSLDPLTPIIANSPLCDNGDSLVFLANNPLNVATYAWAGPVAFSTATTGISAGIGHARPAASGVYTLTLTNGPGANCASTYTVSATVNALPLAAVASPSITACGIGIISATTTDLNPAVGIYFQGITRDGTITGFVGTPQTVNASGTYYFRTWNNITGCWGAQDSVKVIINPQPADHSFIPLRNLGFYCAGDSGMHVIFGASDIGIRYELDTAGVALTSRMGTGDTLDFGIRSWVGNYTIKATDTATGCSAIMTDVVHMDTVSLPSQVTFRNVSSGYCFGGTGVLLDLYPFSQNGVMYSIFRNGIFVDSFAGDLGNGSVSINTYTDSGVYSLTAHIIDSPSCFSAMATTDTLHIYPVPNIYNVTGGDTICSGASTGVPIGIDGSDLGTSYSVWLNGGGPVAAPTTSGLAGPIHDLMDAFSPGTYTVTALTSHACAADMNGSALIVVNPLPTDNLVTGGGDYCINDDTITRRKYISLTNVSQPGVKYQLYLNISTAVGDPVAGDGFSVINWGPFNQTGTYTVIGTDTNFSTACTVQMTGSATITQHSLALVYNVTGAGTFCSGSTGIDVQLDNSEATVIYKLLFNGIEVNSITSPANGPIDFGIQTGMGNYKVYATTTFGCIDTMAGSSTVTVLTRPTLYNVTGGGAACFPGLAWHVGLDGSDTGVRYQLFKNDVTPVAAINGTGGPLDYGMFTNVGTYTIVATRLSTGCRDTMTGNSVIVIYPLPLVQTVNGGGVFCAGSPGAEIKLANSEIGIQYHLYRNTLLTTDSISGSGGPATFGFQPLGGIYTVVAVNAITGCVKNMDSLAYNLRNPLPVVHAIAGGGAYCQGDSGRHVYLDASDNGKKYKLFLGSGFVTELAGNGFGLDYGLFTTPGVYTIVALDTVTGCTNIMAGTDNISINGLPIVQTVTGGGTQCAGGPGFHINLSGSTSSIRYRLWLNGTSIIDSLAGTGDSLAYGLHTQTGTYTVTAINILTLCSSNMTGSGHITNNPLPPVDSITGGGAYCAGGIGVLMGNDNSQIGVNYQLQLGDTNIGGPQVGTGLPVSFYYQTIAGTYRIVALNTTTSCTDTMWGNKRVIVNPLPTRYDVTGTGTYCTLDSGLHVGLNGSDTGISYSLFHSGSIVGSPFAGAGSALDFGLKTAAGAYIVTAVNTHTACLDTMAGSAVITIQPYLVPVVTLQAFPDTLVSVGYHDTIVAHVLPAGSINTFQWFIDRNLVPGATSDTFNFDIYFDKDTIECEVTSVGLCGNITTRKMIVITLKDVAVKQIASLGSDIHLIPNPNKGAFALKGTVDATNNEELNAEITNMLGQVVHKQKIATRNGVVDANIQLGGNLANGMYLLNLRSATANSVFHFVIEQ